MNAMILLALKTTVVLAVAGLAALGLRRSSAGSRHLVWTAALGVVLLLPFLSWTLPVLPAPETGLAFRIDLEAPTLPGEPSVPDMPARAALPWSGLLPAIWLLGSTIGLIPMLLSYVSLARLRSAARWSAREQGVDIYELPAGRMPMTAGIFHPAIYLPADAAEWDQPRRRAVLLHELAHIRRFDVATHFVARLALAAYWWHPLVWVAWRRSLIERERAADDMVLQAGERASEYASHLLELSRALRPAWVGVPMVRRGNLEQRMRSILAPGARRGNPGPAVIATVVVITLAVTIPLAALRNAGQQPSPTWMKAAAAAIVQKDYARAEQEIASAGPAEQAQATLWKAILRRNMGRDDEAEALFKQAVDMRTPGSIDSAVAARVSANFLRSKGREEEAKPLDDIVAGFYSSYQPPAAAGKAMKVGGEVSSPKVLSKVEPEYTEEARAAKLAGTVLVQMTVTTGGVAADVRVLRPLGLGLDEKAIEAIQRWKFAPGSRNGEPVDVLANVEINFRLM